VVILKVDFGGKLITMEKDLFNKIAPQEMLDKII